MNDTPQEGGWPDIYGNLSCGIFEGDDLIPRGGHLDSEYMLNQYWDASAAGDGLIEYDEGTIKLIVGTDSGNNFTYAKYDTSNFGGYVVGKTYRLTFDVATNIGTNQIVVQDAVAGSGPLNEIITPQQGTANFGMERFSFDWTATDASDRIEFVRFETEDTYTFWIDNVSIKQLTDEYLAGEVTGECLVKNYNPDATMNDGSCEVTVYGCTDEEASNYNEASDLACTELTTDCGDLTGENCCCIYLNYSWTGVNSYGLPFYYPVIPKYNLIGEMDNINWGLQTNVDGSERIPFGSISYGTGTCTCDNGNEDASVYDDNEFNCTETQFCNGATEYGTFNIDLWNSEDLLAPITNQDFTHYNLEFTIVREQISNNVLDDTSGNLNYGFAFSDYKPKFNLETTEPKQIRNTPQIKSSKKRGAF